MIALTLLIACVQVDTPVIEGVSYHALESRAATERAMLDALSPEAGTWGDGYLLSPFSYRGHDLGALADEQAPEAELVHMLPGGQGPDLEGTYEGRHGEPVSWMPLGSIANRRVELRVHEDDALNDNGACYLYAPVMSETSRTVELTLGSDDGIRVWFNGELVLENDVPRGLDPEADRISLDLEPGINHFFAKIGQGAGGWEFRVNTRKPISAVADAALHYYLDQDFPLGPEREFYTVLTVPTPEELVLEVGGLDFLPDGRPLVCTRRGELYAVSGAYDVPPSEARFDLWAEGLHEPLGLEVREEQGQTAVYCVQRPELTRLVDGDHDGTADKYETFSSAWGVSGNYHEFAFGPKFDAAGNAWVTLNVGFCGSLGKSTVPWRGWALRIAPDGTMTPICSGLRSPNGIGVLPSGEAFFVDNQGDYVGTNKLSHLAPGSWHGHPSGLRWRDDYEEGMPLPERTDAAVWFPYRKMGQSTADILYLDESAALGPYEGQLLVGDMTTCEVIRVSLEQVEGTWQGTCYPFVKGLQSGVNRLAIAPDGSLLVGETDRGWGSTGRRRQGLERIVWNGQVPFEVKGVVTTATGFELEFTSELDAATATAPVSYSIKSYTYEYHAEYGSDELETARQSVTSVELLSPTRVRLEVESLREGFVHECVGSGLRDAQGRSLLHRTWYTTVQRVPR